MRTRDLRVWTAAAALGLMPVWGAARADGIPVVAIEFKDGAIIPARVEAPMGRAFRLEVTNSGAAASEFESKDLKREKIVAAGGKITLNFSDLKPGDYKFFDDFHPEAAGVLVVKQVKSP